MILSWFRRLVPAIRIRSSKELNRFVASTTAMCVAAALVVDVANQLVFFVGWTVALRSWCITVLVVMAITIPVSRAIGKAHLALDRASRTDPLTGLLNRRALFDGVDVDAVVIALIIVDVDRFKQVNDMHGHLVGDEVLRTVARMMARSLGPYGRVGRLGGEEFGLLASGGTLAGLAAELDRFRDEVAGTPVLAGSAAVSVTISAGLAERSQNQTFSDLYAQADRALYLAKASGRNRVVLADQLPSSLEGGGMSSVELGPGKARTAA